MLLPHAWETHYVSGTQVVDLFMFVSKGSSIKWDQNEKKKKKYFSYGVVLVVQ